MSTFSPLLFKTKLYYYTLINWVFSLGIMAAELKLIQCPKLNLRRDVQAVSLYLHDKCIN